MRITVDVPDDIFDDLFAMTGEKKKSPAISKAVIEFVKRKKVAQFGRLLREGYFDYPLTNDQIESGETVGEQS